MTKVWHNNPYSPDTKVSPFRNGSEYGDWTARNCDDCIKSVLKNEGIRKCELEEALCVAYLGNGKIELWVAKEIGCSYDALYGTVKLSAECRERRTGGEPF